MSIARSVLAMGFVLTAHGFAAADATFNHAYLVVGARAGGVELNVAALLAGRLTEYGGVTVETRSETAPFKPDDGALVILIGRADHHDALAAWLVSQRIPALTERDPGPEGFRVQSELDAPQQMIAAAAVDDRGTLYAAGEILRRVVIHADRIEVPEFTVRTAPAFEVRGTQYGQSHVAISKAKVRPWTDAETQRVILDYALAGANTFEADPGPMFDFLRSYGLMVQGGFGANTGNGPPE